MYILNLFRANGTKSFGLEQLQTLQLIAQQVVFSLENLTELSGAEKKTLATMNVDELLQGMGINAPGEFIDISIEAGVLLARSLRQQPRAIAH